MHTYIGLEEEAQFNYGSLLVIGLRVVLNISFSFSFSLFFAYLH